jgi:acetyltransferase-like isoleucine patch superfamily enzyme
MKENMKLGIDVRIDSSCLFDKISENSQIGKFNFGDYCSIHENCRFYFSDSKFEMGDYGTIHNNTFLTGYKNCKFGHNCWIGQNSIVNATDELTIGNNCGIGAFSKIWTHAAWGELLLGSRIAVGLPDYPSKSGAVTIGDDFWGIGQITISPGVKIGNKVIALTNSLVTKDVPDNTIVGGIPAKPTKINGDLRAYQNLSEIEKYNMMKEFGKLFSKNNGIKFTFDDSLKTIQLGEEEIKIHCSIEDKIEENESATIFNVMKRTYTKKHNPLEKKFMTFLLSYKARFTPE